MIDELPRVEIRPMTAADVDRVLEIAASLREAPHWARAVYEAALDARAHVRRIALVAEEQGAVAGFAVASVMAPEAELETIAVEARLQRRGIARRLFAELAGELRRAGVRDIVLEVRASNMRAQTLYKGLGFAEAGLRTRYYIDPVEDALVLRLELG